MEMRRIKALSFFIDYDAEARRSVVFNAPKVDADGNEIEPGTTDELPADMARKRVDAGEAVYVGKDPLDHDGDGRKGGSGRGAQSTRARGEAKRRSASKGKRRAAPKPAAEQPAPAAGADDAPPAD